MTIEEKKRTVLAIAQDLAKGGYVKGYGENMWRQMSHDHSPLRNIPSYIWNIVKHNGLVERRDMLWKHTEKCSKIKSHLEIEIPRD